VRRASAAVPSDIEQLSDCFTRAQYSPEPIPHFQTLRIHELWIRLRQHLRWLWLGRH
jgi:hypothetical protein